MTAYDHEIWKYLSLGTQWSPADQPLLGLMLLAQLNILKNRRSR